MQPSKIYFPSLKSNPLKKALKGSIYKSSTRTLKSYKIAIK